MQRIEFINQDDLDGLKVELTKTIEQGFRELNKKRLNNHCFTSREVCKILRITHKTLHGYRHNKMISFSQVGAKVLYTESDIEEFLERFKIKSRLSSK